MKKLFRATLSTPLGSMLAVGDQELLYLLKFTDNPGLENEISRLCRELHADLVEGKSKVFDSIATELEQYFLGTRKEFSTPLAVHGSDFKKSIWSQLKKIPYGQVCSYSDLAQAIGRPAAVRGAGQANRTNRFAIVVPCHRVISKDGGLGGYAGGLDRKQKLLELEAAKNL